MRMGRTECRMQSTLYGNQLVFQLCHKDLIGTKRSFCLFANIQISDLYRPSLDFPMTNLETFERDNSDDTDKTGRQVYATFL